MGKYQVTRAGVMLKDEKTKEKREAKVGEVLELTESRAHALFGKVTPHVAVDAAATDDTATKQALAQKSKDFDECFAELQEANKKLAAVQAELAALKAK